MTFLVAGKKNIHLMKYNEIFKPIVLPIIEVTLPNGGPAREEIRRYFGHHKEN